MSIVRPKKDPYDNYPIRNIPSNTPLMSVPERKILHSLDNTESNKYFGQAANSQNGKVPYNTVVQLPFFDPFKNQIVKINRTVHIDIKQKFIDWFNEMEAMGILSDIIHVGGTYNYRLVRNSQTKLSSHSWSTAIDLNQMWNGNKVPVAKPGERGCLYRVVPVAYKYGFFWGGWYKGGPDGMHFEYSAVDGMDPSKHPLAESKYAMGNEQNVSGTSFNNSSSDIRLNLSDLFLFGGGTGTQIADIDTPTEISTPITSGETKGTEGGIPVDRQKYELKQVVNPELDFKDNPNK